MNFGLALETLKQGGAVRRKGWNGKGMFVYMVPANAYPAQTSVAIDFFGHGACVPYNAYFALKGVDGTVSTWAPSTKLTALGQFRRQSPAFDDLSPAEQKRLGAQYDAMFSYHSILNERIAAF